MPDELSWNKSHFTPKGRMEIIKFDIYNESSYPCGIICDFWLLCKQKELLSLVRTPVKSGQQIKECLSALRLLESRCSFQKGYHEAEVSAFAGYYVRQAIPHWDSNPHNIPRNQVFGEAKRL